MAVQIPGHAIATKPSADADIAGPTAELLRGLGLLPNEGDLEDAKGFVAAFKGPPDSVAIIEAGATAASKWWSTGLSAAAAAAAAWLAGAWEKLGPPERPVALGVAGVVVAAAVIAIARILSADVTGRAAATAATIDARRAVATAMIAAAEHSFAGAASAVGETVALTPMPARNIAKPRAEETGWKVIAIRTTGSAAEYLLVKGAQSEWVANTAVTFS